MNLELFLIIMSWCHNLINEVKRIYVAQYLCSHMIHIKWHTSCADFIIFIIKVGEIKISIPMPRFSDM